MSAALEHGSGWQARLALEFEARDKRTVLARRDQFGPLAMQKLLYPEGDLAHGVVLHPPGGLVAGDQLQLDVRSASGSAALLTTPASGKVYRSQDGYASQTITCAVDDNASLEWLPQDTIVFGGSAYRASNTYTLAATARFVARDIFTLGRAAHGDDYASGQVDQRTRVVVDDQLIFNERLCWQSPSAFMQAPWGLACRRVCGALLAWPGDSVDLEDIRAVAHDNLHVGVSLPAGLLSLRCLGDDATAVRDYLGEIWQRLRPAVIKRAPLSPRIWRT